jgi:hypothetical protein
MGRGRNSRGWVARDPGLPILFVYSFHFPPRVDLYSIVVSHETRMGRLAQTWEIQEKKGKKEERNRKEKIEEELFIQDPRTPRHRPPFLESPQDYYFVATLQSHP